MVPPGSDVRLRLVQDAVGLGIWEWDLDSGVVSWDDRAAALLGCSSDASRTLAGLERKVHPADLPAVRSALAAAAEGTSPAEVTFRLGPADEPRSLFARGQAFPDHTGRAVRVVGAVLDVTAAREAADAEAEYARRLSRMAAVSLELAGAETVEQLVEIVVGHGLAVLGADGGSVCVRDDERGVVRLSVTKSLPERVQVEFGELPLDGPLPGSYVARTGETVLLPDRASGLAFTPAMQIVYDGTGRDAWAVLPLQVDRRLLGSLVVSWREERTFSDDDLELLAGFAAQCSQSLDRVQARAAQREA
ncbi:MAG: GAF domain-containing protein, partial [Actinomycetota bacterium]|nr:GAF domain-containing protein [Actinomycetota bacterium]